MNKKYFPKKRIQKIVGIALSLILVTGVVTGGYLYLNQSTDNRKDASSNKLQAHSSSEINQQFKKDNLFDGDPETAWSSVGHNKSQATEWLSLDLGRNLDIAGFLLTPRLYQGKIQAFPIAMNINFSRDGKSWSNNSILKHYQNLQKPRVFSDKNHSVALDYYLELPSSKFGRYFSLGFTKLGADLYGTHYAQLAEVRPVTEADRSSFIKAILFEDKGMVKNQHLCCDSWMMTTLSNGTSLSSCSDGVTQQSIKSGQSCSYAKNKSNFTSNFIFEVTGNPQSNLTIKQKLRDPLNERSSWAWYMVNTFGLDNTLYVSIISQVGKLSAIGKLNGNTISYNKSQPMWDGSKDQPFMYPTFLQNGKGYQGNRDNFVYIYGSSGNWNGVNLVYLARVNKNSNLLDKNNYAYYNGSSWTKNINQAVAVISDGKNIGGMGSAIYNPVLNRYFYLSFSNADYKNPKHSNPKLTLYEAPQPWGPWKHAGNIYGKGLINHSNSSRIPGHTFYNPSFNPDWIDQQGNMWISYSDNHVQDGDLNYGFFRGKIRLIR